MSEEGHGEDRDTNQERESIIPEDLIVSVCVCELAACLDIWVWLVKSWCSVWRKLNIETRIEKTEYRSRQFRFKQNLELDIQ